MKSHFSRFNTILLVLLMAAWAACETTGIPPSTAQTSGSAKTSKGTKDMTLLRLHLEVNPDSSGRSSPVHILRSNPLPLNVTRDPVIDEGHIEHAEVAQDSFGGYSIRLSLNRQGTWLFENLTVANRGRRLAVWSQFGDSADKKKSAEARWLGAPMITKHVADGVFEFTPDASREETDRIVAGLNN